MYLLKKRHYILIAAALIPAQIIFFNLGREDNLKAISREIANLDGRTDYLRSHLRNIQLQQDRSDNELPWILKSLPPSIRDGHEDYEARLAAFLDYLAEIRKKKEYSYTIPKGQKYVKSPVPLYESDIDFTFSFDRLSEVESFFSLILDQHEFPLKISSLDIQRDSGERATCTIKTSFVIPIKQQPRTSAVNKEAQ